MTTARDVATSLGLSVSTVGRALSGDPRISDSTKSRVMHAAASMGYVANRAARIMRGASSDVVAVGVPDISNGFYATIAHALASVLAGEGLQMMLGESADDPETEQRHVRGWVAAQVAGVVIVPTARPTPETVRLLDALPHVQLLRHVEGLRQHRFGIDDESTLRQATEHLVSGGHRRIAYLGGTADLPTGAARQRGYREALAAAVIPFCTELVELGPPSSTDHGRAAVARLLDLASPPTGIVTGSVQITRGVLEELRERDVAVPGRLSLVGFGDEPGWSWWGPGLTTVALPVHELAVSCAMWLLDRLSHGPDPMPHTSISAGTLIVRRTTRPVVY